MAFKVWISRHISTLPILFLSFDSNPLALHDTWQTQLMTHFISWSLPDTELDQVFSSVGTAPSVWREVKLLDDQALLQPSHPPLYH
jgi:hypothetical protein